MGASIRNEGQLALDIYGYPTSITFTCGVDDAVLTVDETNYSSKNARFKALSLRSILFSLKRTFCGRRPTASLTEIDWIIFRFEVKAKRWLFETSG